VPNEEVKARAYLLKSSQFDITLLVCTDGHREEVVTAEGIAWDTLSAKDDYMKLFVRRDEHGAITHLRRLDGEWKENTRPGMALWLKRDNMLDPF
jgi:hypothetical protein